MKIKLLIFLMLGFTLFSCSDLLDIEGNVDIKDKDTSNTGGRDTNKVESASGFVATLTAFDSKQNTIDLKFGLHKDASIGTGMYAEVGHLDTELGEVELAPLPAYGIFDARWVIPNTNGTLVNIFPFNRSGLGYAREYFKIQLQLAEEEYDYQYFFKWKVDDIPDQDDADKNPDARQFYLVDGYTGGSMLKLNMKTGVFETITADYSVVANGSEIVLMTFKSTINDLTSFAILCE